MKKTLFWLLHSLVFFTATGEVVIENFLVRKGENFTIEFRSSHHQDLSKNTTICTPEGKTYCYKGVVLNIESALLKEGLTTIGPYEIVFGDTTVTVPASKVIGLPAIEDNSIDIQGALDPNGSGLFLLRTDWKNLKTPLAISHNGITLREDIFINPCHHEKGLTSTSSGGSLGDTSGDYTYHLKNTADKTITLTNKDFINLPKDYPAVRIDVPSTGTSAKRAFRQITASCAPRNFCLTNCYVKS